MAPNPSYNLHDECMAHLTEWIVEGDWNQLLQPFLGDCFTNLVVDGVNLLTELPFPVAQMAQRMAFEQFVCLNLDTEPPGPIEAFLEEVGDELDELHRDHLTRFRSTLLKLYRAVEHKSDGSLVLEDLVNQSGLTTVSASPSSLTWANGEIAVCRLMATTRGPAVVGTCFAIAADDYEEAIALTIAEIKDKSDSAAGIASCLGGIVPSIWVASICSAVNDADRPSVGLLADPEDESFVAAEISLTGSPAEIFRSLDSMPELSAVPIGTPLWFWYADRENEDVPLIATVWLKDADLTVCGTSRRGVKSAVSTIGRRLGDLLGEIFWHEESLWDPESPVLPGDEDFRVLAHRDGESDAVHNRRQNDHLDEQLRLALDLMGIVGKDQTARELAQSTSGRKRVTRWLSGIEKASTQFGKFDFAWAWETLGLAGLRPTGSLFD